MFSVGLPADFSHAHIEAEHALVRRPVLVLTGGEPDTWSDLSPEQVEQRLAHLAGVRHEVVDGAGHYVHVEQPDAVFAAIERFLVEVDRPAPGGAGAAGAHVAAGDEVDP